jgi:hypothetical protein
VRVCEQGYGRLVVSVPKAVLAKAYANVGQDHVHNDSSMITSRPNMAQVRTAEAKGMPRVVKVGR